MIKGIRNKLQRNSLRIQLADKNLGFTILPT